MTRRGREQPEEEQQQLREEEENKKGKIIYRNIEGVSGYPRVGVYVYVCVCDP